MKAIRWRTRLGLLILGGLVVYVLALGLSAFPFGTSSTHVLDPDRTMLPVTPRPDGELCWNSRWMGGWAWPTVRAGNPLMSSGVGYGIADGDIPDSTFLGNHTFQVKSDVPLKANMHLWYPSTSVNTNPLTLRYIALLDETQLVSAIGSSVGPFYDITMQPGGEITMTVSIPALAPGIHELLAVGIMGPTDEPDNLGIVRLADSRTTLIAGAIPRPPHRTFTALSADGSLIRGDPWISLMLGQAGGSLRAWNWPEAALPIASGQPLEFTIYAGYQGPTKRDGAPNAAPEETPFAVVTLMDYQQVDVAPGVPVFYGQVPKDAAFARVAARLRTPGLGRHDIVALRINYPGVPMCIQSGPPDGQMFPFYLEAKRVAIDVHP